MIGNKRQTTLEDRVQKLEKEVNKMRDILWMLEADVGDLTLAQRKKEVGKEGSSDIKLKINIDTTEAIQQLQRIQKALITDEQLEQVKQELREYWEENIYQKNTPANHNLLPKSEKEQLEKIKNGEIKNLCDLMMRRID